MPIDFDNKPQIKGLLDTISECLDNNDCIVYNSALKNLVQGFSPVSCAISIGDLDSIKTLKVQQQVRGHDIEDAAFYGHLDILIYIESCVTPCKIQYSNALWHAWNKKHLDIVRYLVSKGVDNVLYQDAIKAQSIIDFPE